METATEDEPRTAAARSGWTFVTNHANVLICLAGDPNLRLREIAERVGVTERAVQKILDQLEREGLLTRARDGRRNRYVLRLDRPLHHPLVAHRSVGDLIEFLRGR